MPLIRYGLGLVYGVSRHSQQYCSYEGVISVIGGRKRNTRRKPPTCRKSLTNVSHNFVSSTPLHERGSNSQLE